MSTDIKIQLADIAIKLVLSYYAGWQLRILFYVS